MSISSIILIVVLVNMAFAIGYFSKEFFGADNQIEELSEKVIKENTGIDVDLSPESPEVFQESGKDTTIV